MARTFWLLVIVLLCFPCAYALDFSHYPGMLTEPIVIVVGSDAGPQDVLAGTLLIESLESQDIFAVLDTEQDSYYGSVIALGNACTNDFLFELSGYPQDCYHGLRQGDAGLKLYQGDTGVHIAVVGFSGDDVLRAAAVLAEPEMFEISGGIILVGGSLPEPDLEFLTDGATTADLTEPTPGKLSPLYATINKVQVVDVAFHGLHHNFIVDLSFSRALDTHEVYFIIESDGLHDFTAGVGAKTFESVSSKSHFLDEDTARLYGGAWFPLADRMKLSLYYEPTDEILDEVMLRLPVDYEPKQMHLHEPSTTIFERQNVEEKEIAIVEADIILEEPVEREEPDVFVEEVNESPTILPEGRNDSNKSEPQLFVPSEKARPVVHVKKGFFSKLTSFFKSIFD